MDDKEYQRLLKAYYADKEKEEKEKAQKQREATQHDYKKDFEILELKQKLASYEQQEQNKKKNKSYGSKAGIGFVCAFFLGILGLIIGLIIYKDDTDDRNSFLKGWGWTFGITIILSIIFFAIYYSYLMNQINDIYNSYPF